jgi:hypothetical protein
MQYNIQLINFQPSPNSPLVPYFNDKLNDLASKGIIVKSAILALTSKRPEGDIENWLFSSNINERGKVNNIFKVCNLIVIIKNVECNITTSTADYFTASIDEAYNEILNRLKTDYTV